MSQAIEYDQESEALSIRLSDSPVADSDLQENAVIDYDQDGKIVRLSLYKFNFQNFTQQVEDAQEFLKERSA